MRYRIPHSMAAEMTGRASNEAQSGVAEGAHGPGVLGTETIPYQLSPTLGSAEQRLQLSRRSVAQSEDSDEREFWLHWCDQPLARKLLLHYIDGTGATIILTAQEMLACNPVISVARAIGFTNVIDQQVALARASGRPSVISVDLTGPASATTPGTLANFTVYYHGKIEVRRDASWLFSGTMRFFDEWKFDPRSFDRQIGRWWQGEIRTDANVLIAGVPFEVQSKRVPCTQGSDRTLVEWLTGTTDAAGGGRGRGR